VPLIFRSAFAWNWLAGSLASVREEFRAATFSSPRFAITVLVLSVLSLAIAALMICFMLTKRVMSWFGPVAARASR